jgi:hypothetical protein
MQVNWEKTKPVLWGAVGGAIALAIIGFTWGGWVTGGTAGEMAEEFAQEAVVERLAPICVQQFNQESEKDQMLKELKERRRLDPSFWKGDDYVEKQGWAIIPGEKEADSKVAERCAELLVLFSQ